MADVLSERGDAVLAVIPDPVVVADAETGEIVEASEQVEELLGYEPDELVGKGQTAIHPAGESERYRRLFEEEGGGERTTMYTTFEDGALIHVETVDGERIPIEIHSRHVRIDGRELVVGVFRDTTDRREYEERLERQRDDLSLLNEVMRHDIRNHLQLVVAYAEMLADHVDEEGETYLDVVRASGEQAVELTKTARTLAEVMLRSDSDPEPVRLDDVLYEEIEDVRTAYPEAALTVESAIPEATVVADELLGVVFRNVLKNAIHHNDEDVPAVTIDAAVADGVATVRIADNGPGVPDGQKDGVFGEDERGLESGGTGIGLYLVRSLVDGYGGDVWVEDNDPKGAVFVVELPLADD